MDVSNEDGGPVDKPVGPDADKSHKSMLAAGTCEEDKVNGVNKYNAGENDRRGVADSNGHHGSSLGMVKQGDQPDAMSSDRLSPVNHDRYNTNKDRPQTQADIIADRDSPPLRLQGQISFTEESGGDNVTDDQPRRCMACRKCCHKFCIPFQTKYNPLPSQPSRIDRLKYALLCPPHGRVGGLLTVSVTLLTVWGVLWSITGSEALPGGTFFGLLVLLICCVIGGALVNKMRLPPLLGMLIMGCLLRNVPVINVARHIDPRWSSAIRSVALVVILIRAGLGLDPQALRKLSVGVLRLAFLPCLAETVTVAVASHLFLGFPWKWGFMLGFVLAAVSPAVVVPCLLSLVERGYGVDKGIPTLVIAAASVDDVLAISGFGVVLGITFAKGNLALTIVKGPLEALLGIVFGVAIGAMLWYLPSKKYKKKTFLRVMLLFGGGLFAMFGSRVADLSGAGALGCLTLAFVAGLQWRKEVQTGDELPVAVIMAFLWKFFQPLLFGLIGAEVDITKIQPATIGLGVAVLSVGLVIRVIVSFLAVLRLGLNLKEKLFIPLAWLPKATVQAAIGSVALDTAREKQATPEILELGTKVLTIAVLVILITAPIGAIAITLSAPRFLKKSLTKTRQSHNNSRDNTEATAMMHDHADGTATIQADVNT